jgi:hypothetical protein
MDARLLMHGAFAVGAPLTGAHPTTADASAGQRGRAGQHDDRRSGWRATFERTPRSQTSDALLALEGTTIKAVEGVARTDLHIVFESAARELSTEFEFILSTITFPHNPSARAAIGSRPWPHLP